MKLGAEKVGGGNFYDIQILDAFANYFKHRDEWPFDWSTVNNKHKNTVDIVQANNAKSGSTGNLREGSKILGNDNYKSVDIFATRLKTWGKNVRHAYKNQLESEGVL